MAGLAPAIFSVTRCREPGPVSCRKRSAPRDRGTLSQGTTRSGDDAWSGIDARNRHPLRRLTGYAPANSGRLRTELFSPGSRPGAAPECSGCVAVQPIPSVGSLLAPVSQSVSTGSIWSGGQGGYGVRISAHTFRAYLRTIVSSGAGPQREQFMGHRGFYTGSHRGKQSSEVDALSPPNSRIINGNHRHNGLQPRHRA
jgi:hypothetical protein